MEMKTGMYVCNANCLTDRQALEKKIDQIRKLQ